jgi:hypothetical protein
VATILFLFFPTGISSGIYVVSVFHVTGLLAICQKDHKKQGRFSTGAAGKQAAFVTIRSQLNAIICLT